MLPNANATCTSPASLHLPFAWQNLRAAQQGQCVMRRKNRDEKRCCCSNSSTQASVFGKRQIALVGDSDLANCVMPSPGAAIAGALLSAVLALTGTLGGAVFPPTAAAAAPAEVFSKSCAGCHTGGGNIVRPQATLKLADLQKYGLTDPDELYKLIYYGRGSMPGYGEGCTGKVGLYLSIVCLFACWGGGAALHASAAPVDAKSVA
jgi:mono/diheme cytochrome c family protein